MLTLIAHLLPAHPFFVSIRPNPVAVIIRAQPHPPRGGVPKELKIHLILVALLTWRLVAVRGREVKRGHDTRREPGWEFEAGGEHAVEVTGLGH